MATKKTKKTKKASQRRKKTQASWSHDTNQDDIARDLSRALEPFGIEVKVDEPESTWDISNRFNFYGVVRKA